MDKAYEETKFVIVAAAIKFGDLICFVSRPGRHHNVIRQCAKNGMPTPIGHGPGVIQGFINQRGVFLDRHQAAQDVLECKQPLRSSSINMNLGLFSEDLW